ncbi:MAG: MBL fold metallo-hydrolase [Bacteroidales bacterium]
MKSIIMSVLMTIAFINLSGQTFEKDKFNTSKGDLEITFIGHGSLMMTYNKMVIYIDPTNMFADYSEMPKADLVLVTHEHGDHLDSKAIEQVWKENTALVLTSTCAKKLGKGEIMSNGDTRTIAGITITAVPAYNLTKAFHPRGTGNGYVIQFGDKKVYVAGDTENIPEMADLKNIDIAFLPMNLPYTMTPAMVAEAAKVFRPKILYPYHFGDTKTEELVNLLKDEKGIEVRIRKLN